ncbi:unnamed protein product [Vitrella brassicaformis CCMP3155]|uniref:Ribosomal protein L35Ae n=2 Tax=Vitrella brassicaformis TaxID=1169539 RepID=A0A0G4EA41_VITBC|nr:unnamed protein product [Vitrella brassicaformis CCMP3155]|mmetsp:Transcript_5602/g.13338  ORF Transcript_5602/g.13338 Transcript_5602/m.13338 type:complete len:121 (+) Transcript_5602:57-419(+)|eukprot:CEL92087.1 unnamed protein product [Vitrella brassicaformis CCMP3155]
MAEEKVRKSIKKQGKQPVRLYQKGVVLGYKRSKVNQDPNSTLLKIQGVNTRDDANWYLGKRVAYVYKAKKMVKGSRFRAIWGKVRRPHGNSGVVRARFTSALPPKSFGAPVRVMMYPSNI